MRRTNHRTRGGNWQKAAWSYLVDEMRGNNFKIRIPFPKPKRGEDELLSSFELLEHASEFYSKQ